MNADVQQRAEAAYLGLAIGDALGATVEFMTPHEIAAQYHVHREMIGGGWLHLKAGQVTDDTTMAIALGQAILNDGGEVSAVSVASAFDGWMRSKPVDIGNTVRRGILHFRTTGETSVPYHEHHAGNGACMRVLPVALATLGADPTVVQRAVWAQAHVTHNNLLSDVGTLCVVILLQAFLRGEARSPLLHGPVRELIAVHPAFAFRGRRNNNPSGFIAHTLQVVFECLFDTDSFEACLTEVVNRGGDADTTGAIAGMLAGAHYGLHALPSRWLNVLDADLRAVCARQARALVAVSPYGRNAAVTS